MANEEEVEAINNEVKMLALFDIIKNHYLKSSDWIISF